MTPDTIIAEIRELLDEMALFLKDSIWRDKYLSAIMNLQEELNTPCVLAVAGKVKAGKSFLINSLLGVDIAMTGNTETTATINIFKKGTPPSKEKPILCIYVDGHKEWVSTDYLDSLQGTDEKALAETAKIDKLIVYINDNPLLDYVTLVDTPGIGAEVGEDGDSHQIQTDSYFKLRERHQQETVSLSNSADAIIYLFNTVPTETDKDFLSALYNGGHGITSLNGIGVLSKVDKDLKQIDNIPNFCKEFEHNLYTIVPTSAALEKYIPSYERALRLQTQLRKGFENEKGIQLALSAETAFLHEKLPYCNISVEERKKILNGFSTNDLAWTSFALIAKELYYEDDVNISLEKLREIGGIKKLRDIVFNHFFSRSHMLRGNKILGELRAIINGIAYDESFVFLQDKAKMKDECIRTCDSLPVNIRKIVIDLIKNHIPSVENAAREHERIFTLKKKVDDLQVKLSLANEKFIMFQKLVDTKEQLTNEEYKELCSLFSDQPTDCNPRLRYKYWSSVYNMSPVNSVRQNAAKLARKLYSELIKK